MVRSVDLATAVNWQESHQKKPNGLTAQITTCVVMRGNARGLRQKTPKRWFMTEITGSKSRKKQPS